MKLAGPKKTMIRAKVLRAKMSLPEVLLWQAIRNKQTGLRFRRQQPAGVYILDFYCHAAKLCIEIGGETHAHRMRHDRVRDRWLCDQGITVLRFQARDVLKNLQEVVVAIAAKAPSAELRSPPPPEGEE